MVPNAYIHTRTTGFSVTMQFLTFWLSVLALAVCVLAAEPPKELQIAVTYLPDDCPATAKTGDAIKVHYVSFDSWLVYVA